MGSNCENPENDEQEIQISTRQKKFHFWRQICCFYKKKNMKVLKIVIFATYDRMTICNKVFQISERSNQHSKDLTYLSHILLE